MKPSAHCRLLAAAVAPHQVSADAASGLSAQSQQLADAGEAAHGKRAALEGQEEGGCVQAAME